VNSTKTSQELDMARLDDLYTELQALPPSIEKIDRLNDLAVAARKDHQLRLGTLVSRYTLSQAKQIGYGWGEVAALLNIALYHYFAEDFENALINNFLALERAEEIKAFPLIERCLNNIGNVYDSTNEYEKARQYYERAVAISRELNQPDKIALTMNNIGNVCMAMGDLDKARELFTEACRMFGELGQDHWRAYCFVNLGEVDYRQGLYFDSLERLKEAVKSAERFKLNKVQIQSLRLQGKIHQTLSDYAEAEKVFMQALAMAENTNIKHTISAICEDLADLFEQTGDHHRAYEYFDRHVLLQVAIYEERSRLRMAEMRSLYELELKELELDMQRFRTTELQKNMEQTERTYHRLQEAQQSLLEVERENTRLEMSVTANHEINQPLMIIKGNIDLIDLKLTSKDKNIKQLLHGMDASVMKIRDILQRIHRPKTNTALQASRPQ